MQITRQADYAVRAVLYLSGLDNGRRAPTSEIALKQHIPPSFLAKIVSQLSVAGIVQTSRGARGGVSLARAADEISLWLAPQMKSHCLKWSKPSMVRSC